jgi:D-lactate dehydrogenase
VAIKIAFYDTKPYDRVWFDEYNKEYGFEITYFEHKLNNATARTSSGFDVVCTFVNDTLDAEVLQILLDNHIRLIALRCAGFNNVDLKFICDKIPVVRVPAYSPNSVAEHAIAMLLTLVRNLQHAYVRTREFNFSLGNLIGFDLHGKTVGVIGTGKIGRAFISICKGFGMKVLAVDGFQDDSLGVEYSDLDTVLRNADVVSLHCPLTKDSYHMISREKLAMMKSSAILINTSRGALVDSIALADAIQTKKLGGAALDVYEEESNLFYEDNSFSIITDDTLIRLISMPNVLVTSHQAFLTKEALQAIAATTLKSVNDYFTDGTVENSVCYKTVKA